MTENWKAEIPADFSGDSRVWIYQSDRKFTVSEERQIGTALEQFAAAWQSHGAKVKGFGRLLFAQFIIILADEAQTGVSGCSTDSSVKLVKQLEQQMGVNFFNRLQMAFLINGNVELLAMANLKEAAAAGQINADTLYFNNTVLSKKDLLNNWLLPAGESWLAPRLAMKADVTAS